MASTSVLGQTSQHKYISPPPVALSSAHLVGPCEWSILTLLRYLHFSSSSLALYSSWDGCAGSSRSHACSLLAFLRPLIRSRIPGLFKTSRLWRGDPCIILREVLILRNRRTFLCVSFIPSTLKVPKLFRPWEQLSAGCPSLLPGPLTLSFASITVTIALPVLVFSRPLLFDIFQLIWHGITAGESGDHSKLL